MTIEMFQFYDHDEYLNILNDLRWNSREAIRLFESLQDTEVVSNVNPTTKSTNCSNDFSTVYHNSIEFRQCMKLLGHHLDKIQQISHEEIDPSIFKHKLHQDREKIQDLTAENAAIKKNFLILQRRISSTYCAMSENLAGQITVETQLEDHKQKIKKFKKELNNFKRQSLDAAKIHKEEKIVLQNHIKRLRAEQEKQIKSSTKQTLSSSTSSAVSSTKNSVISPHISAKHNSDQPSFKKLKRTSPAGSNNNLLLNNSPIPLSLSGLTAGAGVPLALSSSLPHSSSATSATGTTAAMRIPSLSSSTGTTDTGDHSQNDYDTVLNYVSPHAHMNTHTGELGLPEGVSYVGSFIRKEFEGHGYFTGR